MYERLAALAIVAVSCAGPAPKNPEAKVAPPAAMCAEASTVDHRVRTAPVDKLSGACTLTEHDLGASAGRPFVELGFGASGGLAAWADRGTAYFRPLDSAGVPRGAPHDIAAPPPLDPKIQAEFRVAQVVAIPCGFVVFFLTGHWAHHDVSAIATDSAGVPLGKLTPLDLPFRLVVDAAPAGPRRLSLLAAKDIVVEPWIEAVPTRVLTLDVGLDGSLTKRDVHESAEFPGAADFDLERVSFPEDKVGWLVNLPRQAGRKLVVDDKQLPAAEVARLAGKVHAHSLGWISESLDRDPNALTLVDVASDRRIGVAKNIPRAAILGSFAWSGTHLLLAYGADDHARAVALDCSAKP